MLDIFVPFLEAHSELTAEEQKILNDFKEKNPIRTINDVEKAQGKFQIYQLPGGDKYHGIRFAGMDELKAEGVQLNKDDYELMYEGEVGEFRGNATLEALFAQFNNDRPDDFSGHSLSVSDVIVISVDGKDTAYFCDSFGFTEMPEFFREKELVQEKPETAKVSDLAVGDVIMYDGARREVEKISDKSISLKDLDAPITAVFCSALPMCLPMTAGSRIWRKRALRFCLRLKSLHLLLMLLNRQSRRTKVWYRSVRSVTSMKCTEKC